MVEPRRAELGFLRKSTIHSGWARSEMTVRLGPCRRGAGVGFPWHDAHPSSE
jgi:hypothetical protein